MTLDGQFERGGEVAGGTPTLTLNDGGTATYTGGSGSNALTFSYTVAAGQNTADLAVTAVNSNAATVTDGAGNAANLSGAVTNPAGTLQIDTTAPTVSSVVTSGSGITAGTGDLAAGSVVTLTVNLSEAVTVAGGTPTLTLNDGGTATYTGGSGSNALTFSYTVGAGQNTADLAVTAVNPGTATVTNGAGTAANLSGAVTNPAGILQIDTTTPVISAIAESPSSGDLNAGKTVTYTLTMNEVVTVAGGSPTLALNDGGTATYTGGSGSNALTFSYTVLAGQNTPDLVVTAVNLNAATVADGAGNAANLSLTGITQGSPQIDTTPPTVSSVTGTAGDYNAGNVLTLTLNMSEAVTVTGTPTLTLNDGGTATYTGGSGSNALTFSYTVASGQNTAGLAVTAVNGTVADLAGNALSTANLPETFTGVIIDTTAPTVSSVAASGSGITAGAGDLAAGSVVTLTVNLSEAVTVAGGTPTLTLNDGGTATYTGGSGSNALTFSYTVAAGQNTADLAVTAVNLGHRDHHGRRRQCRQSRWRGDQPGRHPADRHHGADGVVGGDVGQRHHGRRWRPRGRQRGDADGQYERGGDGGGRHPDADAQRRRHRDLYRRLRQQRADLQLHGCGRPEHRRPGGDGGQSQHRDRHERRRQCRQSRWRGDQPGRHPADRHHGAVGVFGGDVGQRHHGRRWRPRGRQRGDADGQHERGGDGRGRRPDADAQRRRHRDLYRRLRQQRADLQLHGCGRPEHRRPGGDGGQSGHRDRHEWRRQRRQSRWRGDQPGRHPADRHHGAVGVFGGDVGQRHHGWHRRPRGRQRGDADGQYERGGDGRGRRPDADAQRRRHRDLYRRLRHQRADLQLHGCGRPEHRRPGGDGGQSGHRDRHERRRQCRQSRWRGDQPGRHAADRHHGAFGVFGGDVGQRHHGRHWRSRGRQRGDADGQFERGGDGGGRHPDADAQRRRHRDLYRRLRQQRADLQLHGCGRPEHRRPGGDGVQSPMRRPSRTAPAMPPISLAR